MLAAKVTLVLAIGGFFTVALAGPDSAGIVEMEDGLAYGGIPYGSVTGMVKQYPGERASRVLLGGRRGNEVRQQPVLLAGNYRATRLSPSENRPVQIYNLPGVVAPGIVGRITQIGY